MEFRITDTEIKCVFEEDQNRELDWLEKVFGPRNPPKLYMDTIILNMSRKLEEDIDKQILDEYTKCGIDWLKTESLRN